MNKYYCKQKKINGFRNYIIVFFLFILSTSWSQTIYYSKSTGNLEIKTNWGLNSNGSGTSPNNFNGNNCIYIVANRSTATIGANWTINGNNSKLQIGNGTTAVKFIIPSAASLSGTIDVTNTATLTIQNNTIPTIGILSIGSTVDYALGGNQSVFNTSYYNLILSGSGRKTLLNNTNTSITNNLVINSGVQLRLNTSNTLSCTISGSVSGTGTFRGSTNGNLIINGVGNLGTITFSANFNLYKFIVNRTSLGSLTLGSNINVTNLFTHTNGEINLNGKLLTLNNAVTFPVAITNGAFTGSSTSSLSILGAGVITNSLKMTQTSSTTKSMSSIILNRTGTTLNIGNGLDIINEITPTAGTIASGGNITLKASSASVVGRIGTIGTGASVTGNVTAESYALGGNTGWTILGTAGITGRTFADWNDDFAITCAACPQGSLVAGVPFTSIASYNEAAGGTFSNTARYVDVTSISSSIIPSKGYWVYLGNSTNTSTDILFEVAGAVNQGNKTINLSYTSTGGGTSSDWGYNLISNPYPSPISWSLLRNGNASVANSIYVYNPDLSSHATYVNGISSPAVGSGGIGNMIPAGQGFYVKANAATSLIALETNKASSAQLLLKASQTQSVNSAPSLIRIKVNGANMHNETAIYFDNNAHSFYEEEYDAISLGADYGMLDVCSIINDTAYSINGLEALNGNVSIPIKITTGTTNLYQISGDDYQSLPSGACIILHDNLTNTNHNLKAGPYSCTISDTEFTSRFSVNISVNNNINVTSSFINPSCSKLNDGYIIADASLFGTYDFYWKNELDQIIKTSLNKSSADTLTNIANGYYKVDIANSGTCSNGSQSFQLLTQPNINASFNPSTVTAVLVNDSVVVNFSNSSSNADSYYWDFDNGDESSMTSPSTLFTSNGDYEVTLYAINSACRDTSEYSVNVNVTGSSLVTEIKENTTIFSNNIFIDRDKDGYFVQFHFPESSSATISVWNILGEKINTDFNIKNVKNEKVYIPIETSNNLIIITVNAANGEKGYKKIINNQ